MVETTDEVITNGLGARTLEGTADVELEAEAARVPGDELEGGLGRSQSQARITRPIKRAVLAQGQAPVRPRFLRFTGS